MPARRSIARAALAILAALVPSRALVACSTPSSGVDGGDLMGVFEHDGGSDASTDARSIRPKRDAAPDASAAIDASVRAPIEGECVARAGEPNREVSRVVGRPACRDAQVLEWRDPDGSPRYACLVAPRGVEARAPLPLVVFFHDPDDDPTAVDKKTALRKLGAKASLAGDPAHLGFLVLAVQGRHVFHGRRGTTFDTEYTGPDNVDVATVDHFVGEVVDRKLVDTRRIYTLGAASGGEMAATYAMMRADRVAAFATFASAAPVASWSCAGPPPPAMIVYRACDEVTPCDTVERWLRARDAAGADTAWLRLDAGNDDETNCAPKNKCGSEKGRANHHRWPKGREDEVLRFFARHALGAPATDRPNPSAADAGSAD